MQNNVKYKCVQGCHVHVLRVQGCHVHVLRVQGCHVHILLVQQCHVYVLRVQGGEGIYCVYCTCVVCTRMSCLLVQGKRKPELKRTMEITPSTVYNSELQFPMTNYYELEGRVHADSWSIPIKKTESLGKCLTACIRMVKSGIVIEQDENCKKFLEKTMPVAFEKVVMTWQ